ncbi:MAG: DUF559 domain-containing protein [Erysipelotrichales bacterium]|nr:DUF559 domain-containing protein [Erysipelotrichales bacterium]
MIEEEYFKNPNYCKHCNKILSFKQRNNKFCSCSCSVSFNNKLRTKTEEEKKIAKDVRELPLREEYNKNPRICKCGNIIPFEKRFNKYCSQSCGTKYSNIERGSRSEETKRKISKTLKINSSFYKINKLNKQQTLLRKDSTRTLYDELLDKNYKFIDNICTAYTKDCVDLGIVKNINNYRLKDSQKINTINYKLKECIICGNKYFAKITKTGRLDHGGKTCCDKCHKELASRRAKESVRKRMENGTFQGWKPRNNRSYAEKFWMKVLENNNISYISEYPIERKGTQNYFLDFYIEKNGKKIDLEIDGKQHKYSDRLEFDKIRDEYLEKLGYIVYRIDWNKMDGSKELSDLTKEKIDKFLDFYNSL